MSLKPLPPVRSSAHLLLALGALLVTASACSRDGDGDGATDLGARFDTFEFFPDPDLAVGAGDLAEPPDLLLPPDLRLVPVPLALSAPVAYATDKVPINLVTGDWNGDNRLDIAAAAHGANGVTVLLGVGDGTFRPGIAFPVPYGEAIASADLSRDGRLDLVVSTISGGLYVLVGNGDGSFVVSPRYPTNAEISGLAIGDWNGDKKLDVAGVQRTGGLFTFAGQGDGTLAPAAQIDKSLAGQTIAATDLDGDGALDLVVPDFIARDLVSLRGDGKGGFTRAAAVQNGELPIRMTLADLDLDGRLDAAVANLGGMPPAARVHRGLPMGVFGPAQAHSIRGTQAGAVAVADLDLDRVPDLVVADYIEGKLHVFSGYGDLRFAGPVVFPCGDIPRAVVAADFNRDNKTDLAVTASGMNAVTVLLNRAQ